LCRETGVTVVTNFIIIVMHVLYVKAGLTLITVPTALIITTRAVFFIAQQVTPTFDHQSSTTRAMGEVLIRTCFTAGVVHITCLGVVMVAEPVVTVLTDI
jgi:hypothetical protein